MPQEFRFSAREFYYRTWEFPGAVVVDVADAMIRKEGFRLR